MTCWGGVDVVLLLFWCRLCFLLWLCLLVLFCSGRCGEGCRLVVRSRRGGYWCLEDGGWDRLRGLRESSRGCGRGWLLCSCLRRLCIWVSSKGCSVESTANVPKIVRGTIARRGGVCGGLRGRCRRGSGAGVGGRASATGHWQRIQTPNPNPNPNLKRMF